MDFINVLFLTNYLKNPLRLFGTAGLLIFSVGMLVELYLASLWMLREVGGVFSPPLGNSLTAYGLNVPFAFWDL